MVTKAEMARMLRQSDPMPANLLDDPAGSELLFTSILEGRDDMTRTEFPSPVRPASPKPPPPTRRMAWVFATTMAIIVMAIGVIAVFAGGSGNEAAAPGEAPVIESPPNGTWLRTVIEPGFETTSLAATSLGLVAVGDGVWIAEDGGNWRQAFSGPFERFVGTTTTPAPPMTVPPPTPAVHSVFDAVAEYQSTLYAFGDVFRNQNSSPSTSQIVVWSSPDGITWKETVVPSSPPGGGLRFETAISTEGLIAAYEQNGSQNGSRILYREDGADWTILDPADSGLSGIDLTGISFVENRYLAVAESNGIRAIYASTDGLHFTKVPGSDFEQNLYPRILVDYGGMMFAGGFEFVSGGYLTPALWRSPDGSVWERIPLPQATEPGDSNVVELIPSDDGLFVVVGKRDWGETARLSVYRTTDGTALEELAAPAGELEQLAEVEGAMFEGRLILIGRKHCSLECDPRPPVIQLTWTPAG